METRMTAIDYFALALFGTSWMAFAWLTASGHRLIGRPSLNVVMAERRREWIMNSLTRDLKMIDTQIMTGLQNGTAFFASTSIFAIGGCFALLGATEKVDAVFQDMPVMLQGGRAAFEMKVAGLTALFGYSFFKFGWSYRLFNYCTILFGAVPMTDETQMNRMAAERAAMRAVRINIIAAGHFNAGLRAFFMSIGYLGWFVSAYVFIATTLFIFVILLRRQYFSDARRAIIDSPPP
jgi:uncharacterized membrane protein